MSVLKKICLVFLLLVLFIFTLLVFLLNTTTGLHLMLNSATFLIPGLEISSVSGNLHNLTLKQLHYRISGINVSADELHISMDLSCLYNGKFCINDISLRETSVEVKTAELNLPALARKHDDKKDHHIIYAPYPLILRQLSINNIHIIVDTTVVKLNELNSGLMFDNNILTVTPTHITKLLIVSAVPTNLQTVNHDHDTYISLQERINAKVEYKEVLHTNPSLVKTLQDLLAKPLLPRLSNFTMPLHLKLEDIEGEDLRLINNSNNVLITRLRMQAAIHHQYAELTFLDINLPHGFLSAFGNVQMSDKWPINLTMYTTLNNNLIREEKIKLILSGDLYDELYININLSGSLNAQLVLKIQLAQKGLPLMLTLDSTEIWPIDNITQYKIHDIALRLEGEAQNYQMTMKAALSSGKRLQVNIAMEAKGSLYSFTLSRLTVGIVEDYINLKAVVDWQQDISRSSELTFSDINIINQWPPACPIKLAGNITTHGSLNGNNWQLKVSELDLIGNISQNILTVRGSLNSNASGQGQVPKLFLTLGENTLEVKGNVIGKSMLQATLHTPVLNAIFPSINGSVQGSIKLLGNLKEPQLLVDLRSNDLYWSNLTIRRVVLRGKIHFSDIIYGNISLQIDQLQKGILSVNQLVLSAVGNEKQHQLKLLIHGPVAGQLCINGSFNRIHQSWHAAVLGQSNFVTLFGKWHLTQSNVILNYRHLQKTMVISPHCWESINAQICVLQEIKLGASRKINVMLNHFDLSILKPLLQVDMQASGILTGYADLRWNADDNLPRGKIFLVGHRVKINQTVQGKTLSVAFDTINLNTVLDQGRAHLDWLIKIVDNGQFHGQVQVVDLPNYCYLSGNMNINGMSLSLLKTLLAYDMSVDGRLNANLYLGGNFHRPQLHGQLELEQLVIKKGDSISLSMTNDKLILDFLGTISGLRKVISTNYRTINLSSNIDLNHFDAWRMRISTRGSLMRIILPSIVRLDISPDIVFEATPALFMLNGKIDIPWAHIEVQDLSQSTVRVSSDEVLLNNDLKPLTNSTKSADIIFGTNLLVHIGDDVHIDAFGLKAKLSGDLKVVKDKQRLGINGHIDIPSGYFQAYGQNLIVNKGQLLFSGPVDHPYLNIEAIRHPDATDDDVTAGVRITGPINQPKLEIFSDPMKSQQEALSYLLRGQGLEASSTNNNIITSILIRIGVVQSGQFLGKIGEAFGVSDLTLDTQDVGESSQVVISGYIVPDLQVRYGVGVFDSLTTLTLRYRLMSKFYLEAISGLGQAYNLIYRLEF